MPRPAHIAMIGTPMVSHVLPSLEIIRELVARGHRVTYANADHTAELITHTGAELVPLTSTLPVAHQDWPQDPIAAAALFLDEAMAVLPQLHAAYDDDPADLYLYDTGAYAARALAEAQGRPLVQLSPMHAAWEGAQEEISAALGELPGGPEHRARFAAWLERCGAVTTSVEEFTGHPRRVLAMIPHAMQPHADRVDTEAVTFVGPCTGAGEEQDGWMRRPAPEGTAGVAGRLGVPRTARDLPAVRRRLRGPSGLARGAPDHRRQRPVRADGTDSRQLRSAAVDKPDDDP